MMLLILWATVSDWVLVRYLPLYSTCMLLSMKLYRCKDCFCMIVVCRARWWQSLRWFSQNVSAIFKIQKTDKELRRTLTKKGFLNTKRFFTEIFLHTFWNTVKIKKYKNAWRDHTTLKITDFMFHFFPTFILCYFD